MTLRAPPSFVVSVLPRAPARGSDGPVRRERRLVLAPRVPPSLHLGRSRVRVRLGADGRVALVDATLERLQVGIALVHERFESTEHAAAALARTGFGRVVRERRDGGCGLSTQGSGARDRSRARGRSRPGRAEFASELLRRRREVIQDMVVYARLVDSR